MFLVLENFSLQKPHCCAINAHNEVRTTFEALLGQRFEAGIGVILAMETKSSV
jgi:hypothetical protein